MCVLSYDLDLEAMTSILDPDLDILKMHLHTKNEVCRLRLSKVRAQTGQTDAIENSITLHWRVLHSFHMTPNPNADDQMGTSNHSNR